MDPIKVYHYPIYTDDLNVLSNWVSVGKAT